MGMSTKDFLGALQGLLETNSGLQFTPGLQKAAGDCLWTTKCHLGLKGTLLDQKKALSVYHIELSGQHRDVFG